jgi:GNAT superfamily N-acetyltransferase
MTASLSITISTAEFPRDKSVVAKLFVAYAATLPAHISLEFQSFEHEVATLPGKYSAEKGGIVLLAYATTPSMDSTARPTQANCIGCVAVRRLNTPETCELKRLYTVPEGRGLGAGRGLLEVALTKAKELGYKEMLLDTLETMVAARKLYGQYGFEDTAKYYDNPFDGVVFMRAQLK